MLDSETKRRIDTARDILVGKVPDPKSQVEQITIALIYKFMDDMDAESEEFGGRRKFFAKDFARYGWAKLMRSGLGGHETLNLYAEAIERMPENPGIPSLFRDIFKNAYLPYRDPETLRMFLKVIDEFAYDHSERLGDAFEYLLSVLGSQGDAGQFRTPRHIIDFMVEVVDPKKTETVLDPACGTAGFLISSYKHILKANADKKGHSTLTPDEKGRLAQNFTGYDISPDMVRLSLVNMYLHGFPAPHIFEYDTLTSQDRWNEYADVILANPPFMSPKGGIKPHNRFGVQSKRSEVLFVDYMAEHLAPNGRAAIIVPEGIIFQSQTAYKQLRKMLVENALVAVVSLPAGVFNPYAGVKTSILFLDKSLAKRTDKIAFYKVENDGFDLGAQRRPIDKNDLPAAADFIHYWLQSIRAGKPAPKSPNALVVEKAKVTKSGEYNLGGEHYREVKAAVSSWPFVPVREVFRKRDQAVLPKNLYGPVTYIGLENIVPNIGKIEGNITSEKPSDIKSLKNEFIPRDILYGKLRPNLNKVWLADRKGICSTDIFVIEAIEEMVDPALYAFLFRSRRFNDVVMSQLKGAQLPRVGWASFAELIIPLPPLSVQKEIVAEIESYQKVIDGARAVVDHYRPRIPIRPEWPMVEIGTICELINGTAFKASDWEHKEQGGLLIVRIQNLNEPNAPFNYFSGSVSPRHLIEHNELLFSWSGSRGTSFGAHIWRGGRAILNQHIFKILFPGNKAVREYLLHILNRAVAEIEENLHGGVGLVHITKGNLERIKIPLPSLAVQKAIVAEIETEQALVDSNRELIARMEKKIQAVLARVWGEIQPGSATNS